MRSFLEKGLGWPLLVVVLLVSSVVMMGFVVLAARSDGGAQVIDNYYDQAVRFDSLASAKSAANHLGWSASLNITSTGSAIEGTIILVDSTGTPLDSQHATIRLKRPQLASPVAETMAHDQHKQGQYAFSTTASGSGLWDIEALFADSLVSGRIVQFEWRKELR